MSKADLHVHSKFSAHPSAWLWQRFGLAESFTDPEFIYRAAKAQGMQWVTLTDHDEIAGSLLLKEAHPDDVFTGVETTALFPEDGCKVHVLIYGLSEAEFHETQNLRSDLYALRDYLLEHRLTHSVAHATFAMDDRLSLTHLEKLILLFDVFEVINGGRNRFNNESLYEVLRNLTPSHIEELRRRHHLETSSPNAWIKGFTGGSDDHAGIFVGRTYTIASSERPEGFLRDVHARLSVADGRHNDYRALALTLYKVASDCMERKGNGSHNPLLARLNESLFDKHILSIKDKVRLKALKSVNHKEKKIQRTCLELVDDLQGQPGAPLEHKLDLVYHKIAGIVDELVEVLCQATAKDIAKGDLVRLVRDVSGLAPGLLLALPFLPTLRHMNRTRELCRQMTGQFGVRRQRPKRILWFTDTLTDLNGVSVTLRTIGQLAKSYGYQLHLVTCLTSQEMWQNLPTNVINLPFVYQFNLPGYETQALKVPSFLKAIKQLNDLDPDEVYISTPGPVGLMGLLVSWLLSARRVGVYHTDFYAQVHQLMGDQSTARLVENYTRWFYNAMDEIHVPTRAYMRLLAQRGYDANRMKLFRRGIDAALFHPQAKSHKDPALRWLLPGGFNLLYVGRVSKDKRLDFLAECYERALLLRPTLNLTIAGDGPYLKELRSKLAHFPRVVFTGRLQHTDLPPLYAGADLLVFPSTTDTYGMAVLEAQACGLPALVADVGGPQEIIVPNQTGWVVPHDDVDAFVSAIVRAHDVAQNEPQTYTAMRRAARAHVLNENDWAVVLPELFDSPTWPSHLPRLVDLAQTEIQPVKTQDRVV